MGIFKSRENGGFLGQKNTIIAALIILFAALLAGFFLLKPKGATATITAVSGGTKTVLLNKNQRIAIAGQGGIDVMILVKDGGISFINSQCPDHVCENFGVLRQEGQWAFCAPLGVSVRVN